MPNPNFTEKPQLDILAGIEARVKSGELTPLQAYSRKNALGAGVETYKKQYPEEFGGQEREQEQEPGVLSQFTKYLKNLVMPAPAAEEPEEEK